MKLLSRKSAHIPRLAPSEATAPWPIGMTPVSISEERAPGAGRVSLPQRSVWPSRSQLLQLLFPARFPRRLNHSGRPAPERGPSSFVPRVDPRAGGPASRPLRSRAPSCRREREAPAPAQKPRPRAPPLGGGP